MPKKFQGENSKATVARARKEAARHEAEERKQSAIEDAKWADDDKLVQKKLQRKEDKMRKKQEVADRKVQNRIFEEEEMNSLKGAKPLPNAKLTRADILAAQASKVQGSSKPPVLSHDELPLEDNVNRLHIDGVEARTVDEAIVALGGNTPAIDRHPEKRMKAAYLEFEETNLPRLKAENPNMRLSQLKQILKKDWMKSPENPLNQMTVAYNTKE